MAPSLYLGGNGMIKRVLAVLTIVYMVVICVLPFAFGGSVDDSAVRYKSDGDVVYLDSEAIALSDSSDSDSGLRAEAIEANNLLNEIRDGAGLDGLEWDQNLETVSGVRAKECSESFSHTRPDGKQWYTVNSKIQGGENLAFGFDTAEEAVDAWMDSPTHKDNILHGDFSKGAIAIYQDDDGTCYWANEFGY